MESKQDKGLEVEVFNLNAASSLTNPLLYPEILQLTFTLLAKDSKTLRTCREVCQVWNKEACSILKKYNSPINLETQEDVLSCLKILTQPFSQPEIVKGFICRRRKVYDNTTPSLYPPSPQFWKLINAVGNFVTLIDISFISFAQSNAIEQSTLLSSRLKLGDLRKLIFVTCPNLTHLVLREIQKPLIQKQKFLPSGELPCIKLQSLILRNELRIDAFGLQNVNNVTPLSYHAPCSEFYTDILSVCPDLEEVGFYFHLASSSLPYLNMLTEHIEGGRLQKLKSVKRFIYGADNAGSYADSLATSNLNAKFKRIELCLNLEFIPHQLSHCFKSSDESLEELVLLAYYYNEDNFITSTNGFDDNHCPIPFMENLKRLCLRGGVPLEPFLLNAPNLEELTMSFLGRKNGTNEMLPCVKFWNRTWLLHQISPIQSLTKVDIGHCVFICPHDVKVISELCPNLRKVAIPNLKSGCIQAVFQELEKLEELDIVLFDDETDLTEESIFGNQENLIPGISRLKDLRGLRIRLTETAKLGGPKPNSFKVSNVERCLLTDTFLQRLISEIPKLSILHVEAGKFTEKGWLKLNRENFPYLNYLGLYASGISESMLRKFQNTFPLTQLHIIKRISPTKEGKDIIMSGLKAKSV